VVELTEDGERVERAPRRRSRAGVWFASIVTAAAVGLGYAAWVYRERATVSARDLSYAKLTLEDYVAATEHEKVAAAKCTEDRARCSKLDADLKSLQDDLQATSTELEALRAQRQQADERLKAFRELTTQLQGMIDAGQLKVVLRKGRMVVELPAAVLFPSGSDQLSDGGKKTLRDVGAILKQLPERSFMVAGHTDSVPIKSEEFRNNWHLSTARSLTVVEFLIGAGMRPTSLVAAGYGEFDPIAGNKAEEGRVQNRRIEIVLLPNVKELPPLPPELLGSAEPPDAGAPERPTP
jgi:chemotaxis protein MotB